MHRTASILCMAFVAACSLASRTCGSSSAQTRTPTPPVTGAGGNNSSRPPVPRTSNPFALGTNLEEPADWATSLPFSDLTRMSRPWISGNTDGTFDDQRPVTVNDRGWPRSLAASQVLRTLVLTDHAHYPRGEYVISYEGEGRVVARAESREDGPRRIVVSRDPARHGPTLEIDIESTNAQDPVRNLRILLPGTNLATPATFNPDFLDRLRPFRVIRFMDWMDTNATPPGRWADRPERADARWTEHGVPLEVMIELSNTAHADPWFTIPHTADDDYVRRFATLVHQQLAADRRVYVEHSNEVWNSMFPQGTFCEERGTGANLGGGDRFLARLQFHARRSVQIFRIFREVFADHPERVVRVMASQAANPWVSEQLLSFENAARETDVLAVAPYLTWNVDNDTRARVGGQSLDEVFAELGGRILTEASGWMSGSAEVARRFQVGLVAYEGGQHLIGFAGAENDDRLNALFDRANRDPRMGALYIRYLDAWRRAGGGLFVHFTLCGGYSRWGRWGALEWITQARGEAPKYDALARVAEGL